MGALQQLGLILWKNIILRKRQPGLLFLELIWPILILLVVVLVRQASLPEERHECHYSPRAMPSGGGFEFVQSFVCNLDNKCYEDEETARGAKDNPRLSAFLRSVAPIYDQQNGSRNALLDDLPEAIRLLNSFQAVLDKPEVQRLLDMKLEVRSLFRDPDYIKRHLVDNLKVLPETTVDAILDSEVNITKLYELSGYIDFRAIVCDPTDLGQYLFLPAGVSVEPLSEALCGLNQSLIDDVVGTLQRQLDIAAMVRMVAALQEATGDYTEAMMLEDVATLIQLLQDTDSIGSYIQMLPDVQKTASWAIKVIDFINNLQGSTDLDVNKLQEILADFGPLLTSIGGNDTWWLDLKVGLGQMHAILDWINEGMTNVLDNPISLGNLTEKTPGFAQWLQETFNLTEQWTDAVMNSELDFQQFSLLAGRFADGKTDIAEALCKGNSGFVGLFRPATDSDRQLLEEAQETICQLNATQLSRDMEHVFDLPRLESMLRDIASGAVEASMNSLNWTELIHTGISAFDSMEGLFERLAPLLEDEDLGMQPLWNSVTELATDMQRLQVNGTLNLDPWLILLQRSLESEGLWEVNNPVRLNVVYYTYYLDMGIIFLDNYKDFGTYAEELLENNPDLLKLLQDVLSADLETRKAFLSTILNPKFVKMMLENPTLTLDQYFCNTSALETLLGDSKANLTLLQGLLCERNLSVVLNKILTGVPITEFQHALEQAMKLMEGSYRPTDTDLVERGDLVFLYHRYAVYMDLVTGLMATDPWPMYNPQSSTRTWQEIADYLALQGIEVDPEYLMSLASQLQSAFVVSLTAERLAEEFGPMLENTTAWPMLRPFLDMARNVMAVSNSVNYLDLLGPSTATGRLVAYIVNNLPYFATWCTDYMNDPVKRDVIMETPDWKDLLCGSESPLDDVPHADPEGEVRTYICDLDASVLEHEWSMLGNETLMAMFMGMIPGPGEDAPGPFDWGLFVATAVKYYDNTQLMTAAPVPWAFATLNITLYEEAFTALQQAWGHMPEESQTSFVTTTASIMEALDESMSNSSVWSMVKHYAWTMNEFYKLMNEDMEAVMAEETIPVAWLLQNSSRLRDLVEGHAALTPDIMTALQNSVMNPAKMMRALMTLDVNSVEPCNGVGLADFMDFPKDSDIVGLEKALCETNPQQILQELMESPMMAKYNQLLGPMMNNESQIPRDLSVNWTELMINMMSMADVTEFQDFTFKVPDIPGFNMTQVQEQTEDMIASLQAMDMSALSSLSSAMEDAWPLLKNMSLQSGGMNAKIWKMIEQYMVGTNYFYILSNQMLRKLNGTREVSLLELLESEELNKLFESLKRSPDIMDLILNAVLQFYTNPEKSKALSDLGENITTLCKDKALFEDFFPWPTNSSADRGQVWGAICESASLNATLLWEQLLENTEGLREYVETVEGGRLGERVNITTLIHNAMTMQALLTSIGARPPTFDWGIGSSDWLSDRRWQAIFQGFLRRWENVMNGMTVDDLLTQDFGDLTSLLENTMFQTSDVITTINTGVEALISALAPYQGKGLTLDDLLTESATANRLLRLLRHMPLLYEILLTEAIENPTKISELLQGDLGDLCDLDFTQLFDITADQAEALQDVAKELCATNISLLYDELLADFEDYFTMFLAEQNNTQKAANLSQLTDNLLTLARLTNDLAEGTSWDESFDWLHTYNWVTMATNTTARVENENMWLQIATLLSTLWPTLRRLSEESGPPASVAWQAIEDYLAEVNAFFKVINPPLLAINATRKVALWDLLDSAELRKVYQSSANSPEVVEVILNGIIHLMTNPDKVSELVDMAEGVMALCEDIDRFAEFFPRPPNSTVDLPRVQRALCASSTVNATVLWMELLENMEGLNRYLPSVTQPPTVRYNITTLIEQYMRLQALVEVFATEPIDFDWGFGSTDWMDGSKWDVMLRQFTERFTSALDTQDWSKWLGQEIDGLTSLIDVVTSDPAIRESMMVSNAMVEAMIMTLEPYIGKNLTLDELWGPSTETSRLLDQLKNLPALYEFFVTASLINSQKLTNLFSGDLYQLCSMNPGDIVKVTPMTAAKVKEVLDTLCATNYSTVYMEILDSFGESFSQLLDMKNSTGQSVNFTTYTNNLLRLSDLYSRLMTGIDGGETQWTDDFQWLTNFDWMTALMNTTSRLEEDSYWYNQLDEFAESMGELLKASSGENNTALMEANNVLNGILTSMEMVAVLQDPRLIYEEMPQLKKLADVMDKMPDIIAMVMTSSTNQQKFTPLMTLLIENATSVCNMTDLSAYLTLPGNSTLDTTWLQETLCTIDYDAIQRESQQMLEKFYMPLAGAPGQDLNLTILLGRVNRLQLIWTDLLAGNMTQLGSGLPWLDEGWWARVMTDVARTLEAETMSGASDNYAQYFQGLLPVLSQFESMPEINSFGHQYQAAMEEVNKVMARMINETLRLSDLFPGSPELQKLAILAEDMPLILDILDASSQTTNFQTILQSNLTTAFLMICHPSSDVKKFLVIPPEVSTADFNELMAQFCDINVTLLESEFMTEFNVQYILDQSSNTSPVNWTAYFEVYAEYISLTTRLAENPPTFTSEGPIFNVSVWEHHFNTMATTDGTAVQAMSGFKALLDSLKDMSLDVSTLQAINDFMSGVLGSLASRLADLPASRFTLARLLADTPLLLQEITRSLHLAPDILDIFLNAVIQKPEVLVSVLTDAFESGDPEAVLCSNATLEALRVAFELPDSMDLRAVLDTWVCDLNETTITKEILQLLGIEDFFDRLSQGPGSPSNETASADMDWDQILADYQKLSDELGRLLINPNTSLALPEVDMVRINEIFAEWLARNNGADLDSFLPLFEMIMSTLYKQESWQPVQGFYNVNKVLMQYFKVLLQKLDLSGTTVEIGSLFSSAPQWTQLLQEGFQLSPDLVSSFSQIVVKVDQLPSLVTLSPDEVSELLCSPTVMEQYFEFPANLNVNDVIQVTCGLNTTLLMAEFESVFSISRLTQELMDAWSDVTPIDSNEFVAQYNSLVETINRFVNATDVSVFDTDILSTVAGYNWTQLETWPAVIQRLLQTDASNMDTLLPLYQALISGLYGTEAWRYVYPYFSSNMAVMDYVISLLEKVNVRSGTLDFGALFEGTEQWRQLVESAVDVSPDLLTKFVDIQLKLNHLSDLLSMGADDLSTLLCSAEEMERFFIFPAGLQASDVTRVTCGLNTTVLLAEFEDVFGIAHLEQKIMQSFNSTEMIDVDEYVKKTIAFQKNIERIFNVTNFELFGEDFLSTMSAFNLTQISEWPAILETFTQLDASGALPVYETMVRALYGSAFWEDLAPFFGVSRVLMDYMGSLLNKVDMKTQTLDLLALFDDSQKLQQLFEDVLNVSPELASHLIRIEIKFDQLGSLLSFTPENVDTLLCSVTEMKRHFVFPEDFNVDDLVKVTCEINGTVLLAELDRALGFSTVMKEVERAAASGTAVDVDQLVTSYNSLVDKINNMLNVTQVLIIDEDFLAKMAEFNVTSLSEWPALLDTILDLFKSNVTEMDDTKLDSLIFSVEAIDRLFTAYQVPYWNSVRGTMAAANLLLDILTGTIKDWPVANMTLSDLFANATLTSSYIRATFDVTPEAMQALLRAQVDWTKMLTMKPSDWCAAGNVIYATEEDSEVIQQILCDTDFDALGQELAESWNWSAVSEEYWYSRPVNWTVLLSRTHGFQTVLTDFLSSATLPEPPIFFQYPDLAGWLRRLQSVFSAEEAADTPMDPTAWITDSYKVLMQSIGEVVEMEYLDDETVKVMTLVNEVIGIINKQLERFVADGRISFSDLVGNNTLAYGILKDVINLDPSLLETLLESKMDIATISAIFEGDVPYNLCTPSFSDAWTLPPEAKVTLDDLQNALCNTNLTRFVDELNKHWDIEKLMSQLLPPGLNASAEGLSLNITSFYDSFTRLSELMNAILSSPPAVDPSLERILNISRLIPLLNNIMLQEMVPQIPSLIKPVIELIGNSGTDFKALSYVLRLMNAQLDSIVGPGLSLEQLLRNSSALARIYRDVMQQSLNLTSDVSEPYIRAYLAALAESPAANNLLCNPDVIVEVTSPLPDVNPEAVYELLCNQEATLWYDRLRQLGLTGSEIQQLVIDLQSLIGSENFTTPESDSGSLEDLMAQVDTLVDLMERLSALGFLDPSILERLNVTAWQAILDVMVSGGTEASVEQLLSMLREQRSMLMDFEWWQQLETYLYANTAGLDYIDALMQQLVADGKKVQLVTLFPNPDLLEDILKAALPADTAQHLMAAEVNPSVLMRMRDQDAFVKLVCNRDGFNEDFAFPNATADRSKIQTDMCLAAGEGRLLSSDILDITQFGLVYEQMLNVLQEGNTGNWSTPWDPHVKKLLSVIEHLDFLSSIPNQDGGQDLILERLASILMLTQGRSMDSRVKLCEVATEQLEAEWGSTYTQTTLDYMQFIGELMLDANNALFDLTPITCELTSMNLTTLMNRLQGSDVMTVITKVLGAMDESSVLPKYDCTRLMALPEKLSAKMVDSLALLPDALGELQQCVVDSAGLEVPAFTELDSIIDMLREAREIVDTAPEFEGIRELSPILNDIINQMITQQNVTMLFTKMFENGTDAAHVLAELLQLSPDIIQQIMSSSVNINLLSFANITDAEIADILCDPERLSKLVTLPKLFEVNMTVVSEFLCGPQLNETIMVLRDSISLGNVFYALSSAAPGYELTSDWLKMLTNDMDALIRDMASAFKLSDMLADLENINLMQFLGELQTFLSENEPDKIFADLNNVLNDIKGVISGTDFDIGDLEKLARGIQGLNILKTYVPFDATISKLVKDSAGLRNYLINDLGFDPSVADSILSSSLSYNKVANLSQIDVGKLVCDVDELETLLSFKDNSTDVTAVSETLCAMDTDSVIQALEAIIEELDISKYIADFVAMSPDDMLAMANITKEEAAKIAGQFAPLNGGLGGIVDNLSNVTSDLDLDDLEEAANGEEKASAALGSLSSLLCGRDSAFDIQDSYGLSRIDPDENPTSRRRKRRDTGWEPSEYDKKQLRELETQFCKDLYKEVVTSTNGAAMWTYMKPLLRGYVLYTPNTPVATTVMEKATAMFRQVDDVKGLMKSLSHALDALEPSGNTSTNYESLNRAMRHPFIAGAVRDSLGFSVNDLLDGVNSLNSLTSRHVKAIGTLTDLVVDMADCMRVERLVAFDSEAELESHAAELVESNNILGGVVFLDMDGQGEERRKRYTMGGPQIPKHLRYKIRMDIENVQTTSHLKYEQYMKIPEDNFAMDLRYLRGFVQLQDQIEAAVVDLQLSGGATWPHVEIQQLPFPCYIDDFFQLHVTSFFFPIVMTMAWLVAVGSAVRNLVYDKEKRLEQTLRMMGLRAGVSWWAWFFNTFVTMLLMSFIITLLVKLGKLLPYSDPVFVWVFLADFSLSTTMLCYLISVFFNRTTLAAFVAIIIYLISYLPFIVLVAMDTHLEFWHRVLASLSVTCAFSQGTFIISSLEATGVGLQWDNMETQAAPNFSFAWCCYMMLIDAGIYGILGWYISTVLPGKYGVSQPWYFPLSPAYWGCMGRKARDAAGGAYRITSLSNGNGTTGGNPMGAAGPGEPEPQDLTIGISIHNLRKVYKRGKKVALDDMSANFYRGQVTSFLGQNGAGKTTTINLLTGLYMPSSGTAFVEGREILNDMGGIRRQLGVCPQDDVLFDLLTVREHMDLFLSLKSDAKRSEKKKELNRMLDQAGLSDSMHVKANQLSGGQRRRLAVALAFIGGSKVVVLDEPTSGVDPAARRQIWDLITQHRQGRTILLCTHHMDEADVLGDRVVILNQGRLLVTGSPLYLKSHYGSGYHLTMSKIDVNALENQKDDFPKKTDSAAILSLIRSYITGAMLVEDIGSELTFRLPTSQGQLVNFPAFFSELDNQLIQLAVTGYGVSNTTLEDVFLKVTREADNEQSRPDGAAGDAVAFRPEADADSSGRASTSRGSNGSGIHQDTRQPHQVTPLETLSGQYKATGCGLGMRQFAALVAKRFHHHRRDFRSYLSQIFLPVAFVCLAMGLSLIQPPVDDHPSLHLHPAMYGPNAYTFIRDDIASEWGQKYVDTLIHSPGVSTSCMAKSSARCTAGWPAFLNPDRQDGESVPLTANPGECECGDGRQVCPKDTQGDPLFTLRTGLDNYIHNLTASTLSTDLFLLRTDTKMQQLRIGGWTFGAGDNESTDSTVWWGSKSWHSLPAGYNALSNMVLRAGLRDQGLNPEDYGITVYNHPLSLSREQLNQQTFLQGIAETGVALCVLCAFCFVPAGYTIYLISERIYREKRLQFVCGVGIGLYWFTALFWDLLSYLFTVGLVTLVTYLFQISSFTARLNLPAFVVSIALFGWATVPLMYLLIRKAKDTSAGYITMFVINLLIGIVTVSCVFLLSLFLHLELIKDIYEVVSAVFLIFPQFCLGDALVRLSRNQFLADIGARFHEDTYVNPFSWELLGWHWVAMAIQGFVFFVLTLFVDSRPCKRSSVCFTSAARYLLDRSKMDPSYKEDEDVSLERQRVVTGGAKDDLLVLYNLKKNFRRGLSKVTAVSNVSLGIPEGECFGLLGVNGAGKTTTFNMTTGEVIPTTGAALLRGKIISENAPNMHQNVGYCPQSDGLDLHLTVRESLVCYARLKGVVSADMTRVCDAAMRQFQLTPYANKRVKTLSGGTCRKLSTAIALLGDPDLVLLDEPTTGMDPHSRRMVWNNILKVVRDNRSVVLTSHSLLECDALCTRMAIMVNGRFMCLGSGQHLKNKYGKGNTVSLKIGGDPPDIGRAMEFISTTFPGAELKDHHLNLVVFDVPHHAATLADIFAHLERQRQPLNIQDYSVSQTTLDQVFIHFARHQTDGTADGDGEGEGEEAGKRSGVGVEGATNGRPKSSLYPYLHPAHPAAAKLTLPGDSPPPGYASNVASLRGYSHAGAAEEGVDRGAGDGGLGGPMQQQPPQPPRDVSHVMVTTDDVPDADVPHVIHDAPGAQREAQVSHVIVTNDTVEEEAAAAVTPDADAYPAQLAPAPTAGPEVRFISHVSVNDYDTNL